MVIDVNGFEPYWEEIGNGEPLPWLHGGMGCGADWRHIFKEPPAGYRLIWVVPNGAHGPVFGDRAPQFSSTALAFLRGAWRT